jgi:hypothetical protein
MFKNLSRNMVSSAQKNKIYTRYPTEFTKNATKKIWPILGRKTNQQKLPQNLALADMDITHYSKTKKKITEQFTI